MLIMCFRQHCRPQKVPQGHLCAVGHDPESLGHRTSQTGHGDAQQAERRGGRPLGSPRLCAEQGHGRPYQVVTGRLEGVGPAHVQGGGPERLQHSDVVEAFCLQGRRVPGPPLPARPRHPVARDQPSACP